MPTQLGTLDAAPHAAPVQGAGVQTGAWRSHGLAVRTKSDCQHLWLWLGRGGDFEMRVTSPDLLISPSGAGGHAPICSPPMSVEGRPFLCPP